MDTILGEADSLGRFIKEAKEIPEDQILERYPIYEISKQCQNDLKEKGDWIEFPDAIVNLSRGRYQIDDEGKLFFDDKPIPDGVVREVE